MNETLVVMSEDTAGRLQQALIDVEEAPRGNPQRPGSRPRASPPAGAHGQTLVLRVSSTTPVDGYYPAFRRTWDGAAWHDNEPLYVVPPASAPDTAKQYLGRIVLMHAASGNAVYQLQDIGGGGGAAAFSGAKLVTSGLQLVADNTNGVFATWAAGAYDTSSYFAAGQPTRLTAPTTAYYRVSAKGAWIFGTTDPIPAGVLFVSLKKNGSVLYGGEEQDRGPQTTGLPGFYSRQVCMQFTEVVNLSAGDYVEVGLFHQTGAPASWPGGNSNSFFQIERLGS